MQIIMLSDKYHRECKVQLSGRREGNRNASQWRKDVNLAKSSYGNSSSEIFLQNLFTEEPNIFWHASSNKGQDFHKHIWVWAVKIAEF